MGGLQVQPAPDRLQCRISPAPQGCNRNIRAGHMGCFHRNNITLHVILDVNRRFYPKLKIVRMILEAIS
jgi:hypothetical protein